MQLNRHKTINTALLILLLLAVGFYTYQLADSRRSIALFNAKRIENNTVYDCKTSYIGDLKCSPTTIDRFTQRYERNNTPVKREGTIRINISQLQSTK